VSASATVIAQATATRTFRNVITISEEPGVIIEPFDVPKEAHRGDLIRLKYRLSPQRDEWSLIEWKVLLPPGARVQLTVYSEFPSLWETAISRVNEGKRGRIMIPPNARGVITIMVILPCIDTPTTDIGVEFSEEGIYLPPETEEIFREWRKPDPKDLIRI